MIRKGKKFNIGKVWVWESLWQGRVGERRGSVVLV